ncbi:MAG: hypothetical protein ACI9SG_000831 [Maribacter sp.]|jgi:hypothetical protein
MFGSDVSEEYLLLESISVSTRFLVRKITNIRKKFKGMSQINLLYFSLILILLASSCTKKNLDRTLENIQFVAASETEGEDNMPVDFISLTIPKNFDFSTQQHITVVINDSRPYARYDVYAYNDELIEGEISTYEKQEGKLVTRPEYRTDILNQLLFSGVTVGGKWEHQIVLPSYYTQLYIRSKTDNQFSSSVADITHGKVKYIYAGTINRT